MEESKDGWNIKEDYQLLPVQIPAVLVVNPFSGKVVRHLFREAIARASEDNNLLNVVMSDVVSALFSISDINLSYCG